MNKNMVATQPSPGPAFIFPDMPRHVYRLARADDSSSLVNICIARTPEEATLIVHALNIVAVLDAMVAAVKEAIHRFDYRHQEPISGDPCPRCRAINKLRAALKMVPAEGR